MGPTNIFNHYTTDIIKQQLQRNLPNVFGELWDEILTTFSDEIPPSNGYFTLVFYGGYAYQLF